MAQKFLGNFSLRSIQNGFVLSSKLMLFWLVKYFRANIQANVVRKTYERVNATFLVKTAFEILGNFY